jgi:hypothetical protein
VAYPDRDSISDFGDMPAMTSQTHETIGHPYNPTGGFSDPGYGAVGGGAQSGWRPQPPVNNSGGGLGNGRGPSPYDRRAMYEGT